MGTASLSVKEITFLSDGTFHSAGSTGVISVSQGGGSTASAAAHRQAEGAGNYRVNGFELELKYNNGQAVKERILAPSDNDMGLLVITDIDQEGADGPIEGAIPEVLVGELLEERSFQGCGLERQALADASIGHLYGVIPYSKGGLDQRSRR